MKFRDLSESLVKNFMHLKNLMGYFQLLCTIQHCCWKENVLA